MLHHKEELLPIARKVVVEEPLTPDEVEYLTTFQKSEKEPKLIPLLRKLTLPLSLGIGMYLAMFPDTVALFTSKLPRWTNFSPTLLLAVDYVWNIFGKPVTKANIVYHLPNIFLYSFGVLGVKKIIDSIDRQTWVNKVERAQAILVERVKCGTMNVVLQPSASILFIGSGDHIGKQFTLDHKPDEAVSIAETKPEYTDIWNYYDSLHSYDDLKNVLLRVSGNLAGEYIFFPVIDDQIFLPPADAYDLSPHQLDILCQNLRKIEKESHISPKRIIIIGDKFHQSSVHSEDKQTMLKDSEDVISLLSITKKYSNTTLLDPTDIVLKQILSVAAGRKIVFRATKEGIKAYKERFYTRLELLGYKENSKKKGILTVGYDLFEDQTEQQTLSRVVDDYYPVVLSKSVRDVLVRNGTKPDEFLYVPELVLNTLDELAAEQ